MSVNAVVVILAVLALLGLGVLALCVSAVASLFDDWGDQ